tara:strand:+ start:4459 stop:4707 length:249 start_codon:yes stop_codon:yes gene_type:complete
LEIYITQLGGDFLKRIDGGTSTMNILLKMAWGKIYETTDWGFVSDTWGNIYEQYVDPTRFFEILTELGDYIITELGAYITRE